ncbi:hypothetical protein MPER_05563, partial [Moniliophthora perniciosa FA553]
DILNAVIAIGSLPRSAREQSNSLKRPRSPGDEVQQGVSHAQAVLEDLHDTPTAAHTESVHGSDPDPASQTFNAPITCDSTMFSTPLSAFGPQTFSSGPAVLGTMPVDPQPVTNYSAGLPIGMEFATPQALSNPMSGGLYPEPSGMSIPDSVWYSPGNDVVQGQDEWATDWNLFMASIDNLLSGAADDRPL